MNFGQLFQSAEDAVYEVMVWILILPKTLFRSLASPRATMDYVDEEWKAEKPEERFDEYLSPVLLWLLTIVVPWTFTLILLNGEGRFDEQNILKVTLYSMVIPFVYISWVEILNKTPVKRSTLKRAFYKHCYALTPGFLLTLLFLALAVATSGLFILVLVFGLAAVAALPAYEAFVFEAELGVSYKKAFLYALAPQLVLLVIALLAGVSLS